MVVIGRVDAFVNGAVWFNLTEHADADLTV
jgi:hypothetical protein